MVPSASRRSEDKKLGCAFKDSRKCSSISSGVGPRCGSSPSITTGGAGTSSIDSSVSFVSGGELTDGIASAEGVSRSANVAVGASRIAKNDNDNAAERRFTRYACNCSDTDLSGRRNLAFLATSVLPPGISGKLRRAVASRRRSSQSSSIVCLGGACGRPNTCTKYQRPDLPCAAPTPISVISGVSMLRR